jgi:hypothetical protein
VCKVLQFQPRSIKENHKTTRIVGVPSSFVAPEWGSMNVIVWKKGPMDSVGTRDFTIPHSVSQTYYIAIANLFMRFAPQNTVSDLSYAKTV